MKPALRAMLESRGCDLLLDDIPAHFDTAENPIAPNEPMSSFDTTALLDMAGPAPQARTNTERYVHVRQYFGNQNRATSRDDIVGQKTTAIRRIVSTGDAAALMDLFKKRHVWRQRGLHHCTGGRWICASPDCPHVSVPGSDYCLNHILLDPSQKLFKKCLECGRPYPINSECFACRPE
jgi:hypothetical protein